MADNRIVHFEIPPDNPIALTSAYKELLGSSFGRGDVMGPECRL